VRVENGSRRTRLSDPASGISFRFLRLPFVIGSQTSLAFVCPYRNAKLSQYSDSVERGYPARRFEALPV
jgi:hypothetical protein